MNPRALLVSILGLAFFAPAASGEDKPKPPDIVYEKFGQIVVNGEKLDKDIVVESGKARKRKKGPSRKHRAKYNHTPLTALEEIPWDCKTLVVGTGMHGRLPIMDGFKQEAERRGVKLLILKTKEAVKYYLEHYGPDINAVFHITC